ncbi:heat shock factor-binding protein 1-like protein 1 [Amia ocellicauda]|uniref:heat shock factor-binding protein 1-like protein 1 n=1 Tax=Amia ocellicauda TaxID=2972642 RepID=UPI003464B8B3|nr:HSBP1 protein [Amia calva]
MAESNPKTTQDLSDYMETMMQNLQSKFQAMSDQIVSRMDEMGNRINALEKNVADLMTQAGMEEPQADIKYN